MDRAIFTLLAQRDRLVAQAAFFKTTTDEVRATGRVEQVIAQAITRAHTQGANPKVVERVYRAMIAALIEVKLEEHAVLNA
ncbi:chorismate mutase [Pseudomonas fluvialis]|uniref:chorismate mutase n=1 Tax=Pseudomonas fluvialis TaxID=1793966 RepID=UPI0035AD8772